jgi:Skp family chaperone for outer membrane proteins
LAAELQFAPYGRASAGRLFGATNPNAVQQRQIASQEAVDMLPTRQLLYLPAQIGLAIALPTLALANENQATGVSQKSPAPLVSAQADGGVVAAINMRYVASRSKSGRAAFERLDELGRQKRAEIEARSRSLLEERRKLEQDPSFLSGNVQGQLAKAFEKARIEFERFREDAEVEVLNLRRQVETEFAAKVTPVIDTVARERGLHFVFDAETGPIVWLAPVADISDEVVSRLDAKK